MSAPAVDLRPSATDAYRQDVLSPPWEPPTPYLAKCIEIATVLDAATTAAAESRDALVNHATHLALELLAPETAIDCWYDLSGTDSPTTSLRALAIQIRMRGHLRLATHILDSIADLFSSDAIEAVRILNARAADAWLAGDDALMRARAERLYALARRVGTDEALLLAWLSLEISPLFRGNLPGYAKAATRSLKYALRTKNPRAIASGYGSMSIVHGLRGEYAKAITAHWESIRVSDHPVQLTRLLTNTAETLHRGGYYSAARSARAVILSQKLDPNLLFVVLGGYAESCAGLRDVSGVRWAAGQALTLFPAQRPSRGIAQGLLGCADACARLGLTNLARPLRAEGMAIADAKGYHDLRLRAEPVAEAPALRLDAAAEAARQSIEDLAPEGVSMNLELAAH